MEKKYSVQFLASDGHAMKVWENGRTAKFTHQDAKVKAKEMRERTGRSTKVYQGWTLIETFA